MGAAMTLIGKGGTCVVTAVAADRPDPSSHQPFELTLWQRRDQGQPSSARSTRAVTSPTCVGLYRDGELKLDELITNTYTLDQINDGYQDMRDGKNIRGSS